MLTSNYSPVRKQWRVALLAVSTVFCAEVQVKAAHCAYRTATAAGLSVNVVTVNLNEPCIQVRPQVATGFDSRNRVYVNETFSSMVGRLKPVAAINGTFFDKYTLKPVGSLVVDGQLIHNGDIGTAACIKEDGTTEFRLVSGTLGSRLDWSGCRAAICCGPTLVTDGQIHLNPRGERFRDPHVYARMQRSALGVTAQNKLLLVTSRGGVSLEQWAAALKSLGAVNAINLDGGASSALYFRGKTITTPGRKLTNILTVYEK